MGLSFTAAARSEAGPSSARPALGFALPPALAVGETNGLSVPLGWSGRYLTKQTTMQRSRLGPRAPAGLVVEMMHCD